MRLVFVNHIHPETPHVSAVRMREFARACADLGHQVVLLTETLTDRPPEWTPETLPAALKNHDWHRPFHLACAPIPGRLVRRLREGRMIALLRKPLIVAAYLARSGVFTDWRDGSRAYWPALAEAFRPEAVWATFGNTDALAIAQGLARQSGCRWVMDLKDPWSAFLRAPLRRIIARRFADCTAITALSQSHAEEARQWFGRLPTVVYSGIGDDFLALPSSPPAGPDRILVVGALYDQENLDAVIRGIGTWAKGGETVTYLGAEGDRFLAATKELTRKVRVETPGYVDLTRLRAMAAESMALAYVRNPRALYQHKLIELLALDRPVLCLPGESSEAHAIADSIGGTLVSCPDSAAFAAGLAAAGKAGPVDREKLAAYTWRAQANRLLRVLGAR
ncbi:MAG: glycosyltransferase family 4 protein [Alphaproteobacteria bacterium]|nr:glycosyltransferase family 4 protein [Alphaproteobacteria bacterium]